MYLQKNAIDYVKSGANIIILKDANLLRGEFSVGEFSCFHTVSSMVYYINDRDNQLCRRVRSVPKNFSWGGFLQNYIEPIYKNFQTNGLSGETFKL